METGSWAALANPKSKMASLFILTVGTGTAGKHSDVAQGLANTIRQVRHSGIGNQTGVEWTSF